MAATSFPSQVFIVRHGEKPGDPCKDDDLRAANVRERFVHVSPTLPDGRGS